MTERIEVQLIGSHPHAREYGHIDVVDGMVTLIAPLGIGKADMVRVELENCIHGTDACYAKQSDMRLLRGSLSLAWSPPADESPDEFKRKARDGARKRPKGFS